MLSSVTGGGRESPAETYEAIEAAVMESKRGRWFLAEHARRLRSDETHGILDALKRLEAANHSPPPPSQETARQLQSMGRELLSRSDAIAKIASTLEDGEVRHRLAGEADALRLLALSHQLLYHRIEGSAGLERQGRTPPPAASLTPDHVKFFAGDEDLFDDLPRSAVPANVQHDQISPPVRNRIVIIRHAAGQDPAIPLQGESSS